MSAGQFFYNAFILVGFLTTLWIFLGLLALTVYSFLSAR